MCGVLPEGKEPRSPLTGAFWTKQIKILRIGILFTMPLLPNKMHIKPKNRKDLQLVFFFLLSSLATLSAECTISFLESSHSASGPGRHSYQRQG